MSEISVTIYSGDLHYSLATPLIPLNPEHLSAIWAFCASPYYNKAVREIEQGVAVTTDTLAKVPFDLEHWQKVAAEKYPDGLPKPFLSKLPLLGCFATSGHVRRDQAFWIVLP
jgi:hypothetical protein